MPKITPFLWFETRAEEAMNFYVSVFSVGGGSASGGKNSKVLSTSSGPDGSFTMGIFELEGQKFYALSGGPPAHPTFNESISFFVDCDSQAQVDELWEKLTAGGGTPSQCGWLKDKFGISWQIIPKTLGQFMGDPDPVKAKRVMEAMMKMTKIDVSLLQQAYDGH